MLGSVKRIGESKPYRTQPTTAVYRGTGLPLTWPGRPHRRTMPTPARPTSAAGRPAVAAGRAVDEPGAVAPRALVAAALAGRSFSATLATAGRPAALTAIVHVRRAGFDPRDLL